MRDDDTHKPDPDYKPDHEELDRELDREIACLGLPEGDLGDPLRDIYPRGTEFNIPGVGKVPANPSERKRWFRQKKK